MDELTLEESVKLAYKVKDYYPSDVDSRAYECYFEGIHVKVGMFLSLGWKPRKYYVDINFETENIAYYDAMVGEKSEQKLKKLYNYVTKHKKNATNYVRKQTESKGIAKIRKILSEST